MDIAARLTFRLTPTDAEHVAIIANRLHHAGRAFVSRTEAIREALRMAAETAPAAATPRG